MKKHILSNENPPILNDFLNYLVAVRGYSVQTIKAYNSDLIMFFKFLKEYMNLKIPIKDFSSFVLMQVKKSDIIAFLVYLNYTKDNIACTRQRKLSAIRQFYKWLLYTIPSISMPNPTKDIENVRKIERLPKYLTLSQAKEIQRIFTLKNSKYPVRNNAIITLLLSTGLRASELININLEDINFNQNSIFIRNGKGHKERYVYFSNFCKEKLIRYIETRNRNTKLDKKEKALFINHQSKRLGISGLEDICKKAYKLMGIGDRGYTTHTLRHTSATILYEYSNLDILLLREFLGHSSINATEIYTHISSQKIKEAIEKNPLSEYSTKLVA